MESFYWESDRPLLHQLVLKVAAVSGLCLAVAILLFVLDYPRGLSVGMLLLGVLAGFTVLKREPVTVIAVSGLTVTYGTSLRVNLKGLQSVSPIRQFGIEEILALRDGRSQPLGSIPLYGVPSEVRTELERVLKQRIGSSRS